MAVRREDRGGAPIRILLRIGCSAWDIRLDTRLDHMPQEAKGRRVGVSLLTVATVSARHFATVSA